MFKSSLECVDILASPVFLYTLRSSGAKKLVVSPDKIGIQSNWGYGSGKMPDLRRWCVLIHMSPRWGFVDSASKPDGRVLVPVDRDSYLDTLRVKIASSTSQLI